MINKMRSYSEYIESGIEWLGRYPKHWQLLPCRAVVNHIVEKNYDGRYANYLSLMANIGVIKYEDKGDIGNKKPEDLTKCKIVKKGQLVINSMNYSIGSYGMSPYEGVCSPVYIILEAKKDVILNRYALRVFENSAFQKHLATFGNGILAHRSAIGWDDIKGEYIPLPPVEEQSYILSYLDHETAKIDQLIDKQRQLIELLKEKRQAVISHTVTKGLNPNVPMKDSGVTWLGDVPAHWSVGSLGYYATLETGATPSRANMKYWNGSIPWVKTGEVKYDTIYDTEEKVTDFAVKETSLRLSPVGTLLMAMYGQGITRGRVAILGVPATYNQACVAISAGNEVYIEYLKWFFIAGYHAIRDGGNETSQMNLNADIVRKFKVLVPSIKEQRNIVENLTRSVIVLDELLEKAEHAIRLMSERRIALISAAVTGKIDVRE